MKPTVQEIRNACPGADAEFVLDQADRARNLIQVRKDYAFTLIAKIENRDAEIARLKAETDRIRQEHKREIEQHKRQHRNTLARLTAETDQLEARLKQVTSALPPADDDLDFD